MSRATAEQVLQSLKRLDSLKAAQRLFADLNYDHASGPIARRGWTGPASEALSADPQIIATGGEGGKFQIIHSRLQDDRLSLTQERAVIERLLRQHPYALFLFSNKDDSRWHFVNVKIAVLNDPDAEANRTPERRRLFRRISIGPEERLGERLRTATERLALLDLENLAGSQMFDLAPLSIQAACDEAFDVEKVQKEFFQTLNRLYKEHLLPDIQRGLRDEGKAGQAGLVLLNRLLFLYFVQKKGWLAGKANYLVEAFRPFRSDPKKTSFYSDFLRPLFEALATPKSDRRSELSRFKSIPFLNGGLFEMEGTLTEADLKVSNATFTRLFDELLERHNFTVTEDTPLDVEVAVDPEMLGKIFEELVTGRHESGAYYTPRPIVSFMCREALKGYLGGGPAIERFVDQHDASALKNPEQILEKLRAVKACDPACGSGAYLVGLLHELVALRQCLFASRHVDSKTDYERKLEIIQNCLYGVDIDPIAIHLARLRLWLTLAVEFEGAEPPPLPNLDFKIERGDSLTAPDPSGGPSPDMFRQHQIEEFEQLKNEYSRKNIYGDKTNLRIKIEALRQEITRWAHLGLKVEGFDWRVEFAEVLARNPGPGFDVVLANPPYVRKEEISAEIKPYLQRNFGDAITGRSDLYCSFFARAIQLLRSGGCFVFITSSSWLDAGYGGPLQQHLLSRGHLVAIFDSLKERQFSTALVNTVITDFLRCSPQSTDKTSFVLFTDSFDGVDPPIHSATISILDRTALINPRRESGKWGGKHLRAPSIYRQLLTTGRSKLRSLGQCASIFGYIHDNNTGDNFPLRNVLWSLRDADTIRITMSSEGVRRVGIKAEGTSNHYAPILIARTFGSKHLVLWAEGGILAKEFYRVTPGPGVDTLSLVISLNSTWGWLQRELLGIKGLGGGAIKFAADDVSMFEVVPDLDLTGYEEVVQGFLNRKTLDYPDELKALDRRQLDNVLFRTLGMEPPQAQQIYSDVLDLVRSREERAQNIMGRTNSRRGRV